MHFLAAIVPHDWFCQSVFQSPVFNDLVGVLFVIARPQRNLVNHELIIAEFGYHLTSSTFFYVIQNLNFSFFFILTNEIKVVYFQWIPRVLRPTIKCSMKYMHLLYAQHLNKYFFNNNFFFVGSFFQICNNILQSISSIIVPNSNHTVHRFWRPVVYIAVLN